MAADTDAAAPPVRRSAEIGELVKALAAANLLFEGIRKNRTNPHLKSSYANLVAYLEAVREPLAKNGLAVAQLPRPAEGGGLELATVLMHQSGQWIESALPVAPMADPQKFGGLLTYMRRYGLCAMLGLSADEDDDDGHSASQASKSAPRARQPDPEPDEPPAKEYRILRKGKADLVRTGPDAYVKAWKALAAKAPEMPHEFRAWADENAPVFDALCKSGDERLVKEISAIVKAAIGEDG